MKAIGLICTSKINREIALEEMAEWLTEQQITFGVFPRPGVHGPELLQPEVMIFKKVQTLKRVQDINAAFGSDAKFFYISPGAHEEARNGEMDLLISKSHYVCNNWIKEEIFRESIRNGLMGFFGKTKRSKADVPSVLHLQSTMKE